MNSPVSFKTKIKEGEIKRADAMKIRYADIHVEPGFNLRLDGPELQESIGVLADYIFDGGQVPALEVRPRAEGGVWIVDGHRRYFAYGQAIERGAEIEWIPITAFAGNDADRVARIMTSAEGRPLAPIETCQGYKRLSAFGMTPDQIARKVGKTRQHVEQLLILANANSDVHTLVASGVVSAALAIDAVRKHGEGAGAFLAGKHDEAKAAGKSKVTAATMKPKALPRAVVETMTDSIGALVDALSNDAMQQLAHMEAQEGAPYRDDFVIAVPAWALRELVEANAAAREARETQARKDRERAAKAAQMDIEGA